ncbi:RPS5 [Ecytonucleospora hepatopenaei]|uniref:RPS5 n=1 Tax=Ecytonucleospora hepatopenaei TaxID=646526 RepID=A0A1W0E6U9_9MICR|nr:RPS5 [Ecytonucleospora hepatopenaei]
MSEKVELKLFNKYSFEEVKINDESLRNVINIQKTGIVPHTATKEDLGHFGKCNTSIIERFVVHLMQHGRNSGKKRLAMKLFMEACEIMSKKGGNPIQMLVDAVINAGPREISARVGRGGNMKRASVDVSPYKRVAKALQFLADAIRNAAFGNKKQGMPEIIAYEIMACAAGNQNSMALKKKEEVERIAKSNR